MPLLDYQTKELTGNINRGTKESLQVLMYSIWHSVLTTPVVTTRHGLGGGVGCCGFCGGGCRLYVGSGKHDVNAIGRRSFGALMHRVNPWIVRL